MVLEKFEMRRGSSKPIIEALVYAAQYVQSSGKTAAIYYDYNPKAVKSSGTLEVEEYPARTVDTYDTLVMKIQPDTIPGNPPYPTPEQIQEVRDIILRLYRRLYYRGYGRERWNDPEIVEAWRARRREYNRRYREKRAGLSGS